MLMLNSLLPANDTRVQLFVCGILADEERLVGHLSELRR